MEAMMGALDISLSRDGSGTSWLPDATPMYALHAMSPWLLMPHGNAFLQYIDEGGHRGDEDFGSINWGDGQGSPQARRWRSHAASDAQRRA